MVVALRTNSNRSQFNIQVHSSALHSRSDCSKHSHHKRVENVLEKAFNQKAQTRSLADHVAHIHKREFVVVGNVQCEKVRNEHHSTRLL